MQRERGQAGQGGIQLRHLGTARAGAYFSAAPFAGAALLLMMLGEVPGTLFWIAAALMADGIWLHLTASHAHEHEHLPMYHVHVHTHDEHHQHEHDAAWDGSSPHVHRHPPLRHSHPHYPDIHHRHEHRICRDHNKTCCNRDLALS